MNDGVDAQGCITLTLEGQEFTLRPSYLAVQSFERLTDKTLFDLAGDATRACLSLEHMAIVVTEMLHAYGKIIPDTDPMAITYRHCKPENIGRLLYEYGLPRANARIALVLLGALTGGYTAEGELKAARS